MTQIFNKDAIIKKWGAILGSQSVNNLNTLWENQQNYILEENTQASINTTTEFPSILPISMKIAAKTFGQDLVSVQPIEPPITPEKLDEIKRDVISENRNRKIESITEQIDYNEMNINEHPDYKSNGTLLYLDFKYDSGTQSFK
jgi:hypothetical protein